MIIFLKTSRPAGVAPFSPEASGITVTIKAHENSSASQSLRTAVWRVGSGGVGLFGRPGLAIEGTGDGQAVVDVGTRGPGGSGTVFGFLWFTHSGRHSQWDVKEDRGKCLDWRRCSVEARGNVEAVPRSCLSGTVDWHGVDVDGEPKTWNGDEYRNRHVEGENGKNLQTTRCTLGLGLILKPYFVW